MNIYNLAGDKTIHLFKLYSKVANLDKLNFCGYEGVTYQGEQYQAIPCEITGYSVSISGVVQPTLNVFSKVISPLIRQYNHLLGWELAVLRIKKSQLAIVNPLVNKPFDIFTIAQKTSEIPGQSVSFKLKPRTNLKGQVGRPLNATCSWVYRGAGCEYQGSAMYTATNEITNDKELDICALTLTACRRRNNVENFGGIPTINDYSST
jgi:lambda family phage minor tail protein L